MGAILDLNPSLVQYVGGYGRAAKAIGDSMVGIGQLDIEDKKQKEEQRIKNAQLQLMTNADTRAQSAQDYTEKKDFQTRNDKLASNAASNALLLGEETPVEMSNRYAQLSLMDPTITAAALKADKEKYAGTAGGIIFNTATGQIAGDYRTDKDGTGIKGAPSIDTMIGGKLHRTFFRPDGTTQSIPVNGTALPLVYQDHAASIDYGKQYNFPVIKNTVTENITASDVVEKGGLPITFSSNPKIAAEQKKWALPLEGGGWYVPRGMVNDFKKQFPSK